MSDKVKHGTSVNYIRFGCRCGPCGQAYSVYRKDYFVRHPEQLAKKRELERNRYQNTLRNSSEHQAKRRKWWLQRQYGLSEMEYEAILVSQDGGCAVCGTPEPEEGRNSHLHVDHDHHTGRVRGLLCARCNTLLGQVEGHPKRLIGLLGYLARTNSEGSRGYGAVDPVETQPVGAGQIPPRTRKALESAIRSLLELVVDSVEKIQLKE